MALTVIQKPDQTKRLIPAYSDIIFVIGNGQIAGNFRHKYVLKIYSNPVEGSDRYLNGNKLLATLKTPANSDGNGVFNIAKILQDNVETGTKGISTTTHPSQTQWRSKFNGQDYDDAPHSIHQVDGFCGQRKMIRRFYVAYQEEFATTSTGAVTLSGTGTSPLYGVFNGVLQLEDGFEGFDYTPYILSSAARKFMSTQPSTYTRKWRSGDFGVISFLNGQFDSDTTNTSLNSQTRSIRLQFFNSSHALLNTIDYPINSSSLGGTASVGNTTAGLNTIIPRMYDSLFTYRNINCIQSVGIGFNNIEIRNGVQTGTSYYTIHAINSVGSQKSVKIKIQLTDEDCKGLETIRLAYVNTLGTWDYFNFYKKSTRKSEIKRSYYRSNYGDYGGATTSQGYTQSSAEGGKRSFATNVEEVIEANTDFLTEVEVGFMKELFISPQVYMQVGTATSVQFVPVCVEEKEYIKQTTANDMLKQYIIEVRKGHKTRVQGL